MIIKKHVSIFIMGFLILGSLLYATPSSEHDKLERESISILEWIPIIYDDIISFFSKNVKQDRTNTLAGVDSDNNGIRDDIDAYINTHYSKPKEHDSVVQTARNLQQALLVNKADINKVREVARKSMRATNCEGDVFNLGDPSNEIESLTTNTKARLLEYLRYSKALDGTAMSWPEGDTCE